MFPLFDYDLQTNDPTFNDRVKTRRPATQMEVLQRRHEIERQQWLAIADQEARSGASSPALSERMTSIRQSLSRMFINIGQRIEPQGPIPAHRGR